MKKASPFICGTVILTLSNFFSRLIGFYNRIFLAGVIGAHQIGIYQLIFPVYLLGFAVCFQGFQIALSKITAEKKAAGNINAARYVLRITIILTPVSYTHLDVYKRQHWKKSPFPHGAVT